VLNSGGCGTVKPEVVGEEVTSTRDHEIVTLSLKKNTINSARQKNGLIHRYPVFIFFIFVEAGKILDSFDIGLHLRYPALKSTPKWLLNFVHQAAHKTQ
jgi:hypothetical protein